MAKKPKLTLIAPTDDAGVIPPPRKLGPCGTALWTSIQSTYQIDDVGGAELLAQAAEVSDLVDQLQREIAADGVVLRGRSGVRDHPALRHLLGARAFIVRTLMRLGLNFEPIRPHSGRPPGPIGFGG